MRKLLSVMAMMPLVACVDTPPPRASAPPPPVMVGAAHPAGLDRVLGRPAAGLLQLFGEPDLDVREGQARKLQFVSVACVLDAYLMAPAAGREPVVRYIDTRLPSGDDVDQASCIAALTRRSQAR